MARDLDKVIAATNAYSQLLEAAKRCRDLHREAGEPIPAMLQDFLGMGPKSRVLPTRKIIPITIEPPPAPDHGQPPLAKGDDWISIWLSDANPSTVIKALSAKLDTSPPAFLQLETERTIKGKISSNSFWGMLQRLKGESLIYDLPNGDLKWANADAAPVITEQAIWGPPKVFSKTETAAFRRDALLAMLRNQPNLRIFEIAAGFSKAKWKIAVNKDAIKSDLRAMIRNGLVKRDDEGRYALVEEEVIQKAAKGGLLNFA